MLETIHFLIFFTVEVISNLNQPYFVDLQYLKKNVEKGLPLFD